jgi:uncharacterized protein (DUF1778 family)
MLSYADITALARANVRVSATTAALIAQAANAEYIAPREHLLEALHKRTKEQFETYKRIMGDVEERGRVVRHKQLAP